MLGSNTLEVAIGIIFVFLLVSTICTAIREGIESWLKTRAGYLEHGIRQLFTHSNGNDNTLTTGNDIVKKIYNHPQIFGLFTGKYKPGKGTDSPGVITHRGGNLPSYIPSKNFAVALMDIAVQGAGNGNEATTTTDGPIISLADIRKSAALMENPVLKSVLLTAIDSAQGDINKAQANIESWYNSSMDRVSGWYKRSTQVIIFWIALAVAVGLNINTITIVNYLSANPQASKAITEAAALTLKDSTKTNHLSYNEAKAQLDAAKLPIGWDLNKAAANAGIKEPDTAWNNFWAPVLGWLLTAVAATLGAPFWFDMLNKVMVIRSTVKPHEKSGEETSRDNPASTQPQIIVQTAAAAPAAPAQPTVVDTDHIDGCEVVATELTADHELPESKGGME